MSKLYTIDEAAALLRISERSIYRHVKSGALKASYIGGRTLFEQVELEKFIKRGVSRAS